MTAPPLLSVTVPLMLPRPCCPAADRGRQQERQAPRGRCRQGGGRLRDERPDGEPNGRAEPCERASASRVSCRVTLRGVMHCLAGRGQKCKVENFRFLILQSRWAVASCHRFAGTRSSQPVPGPSGLLPASPMMKSLPRLPRSRASDSVFDILRENILGRGFRPGDRLDVRALADQLGVSATPVKDAVTRLAAEGLVEIRPRSGTFVAELAADAVAETFEIRRALECLAAEHVVGRLTPDLLSRFTRDRRRAGAPGVERARAGAARAEERRAAHVARRDVGQSAPDRALSQPQCPPDRRAHSLAAVIRDESRLEQERREHRAILEALEGARRRRRSSAALDRHIRRAGAALVDDVREARVGAA